MEEQKIQLYLTTNAKYFQPTAIPIIKSKLEQISDERYIMIQGVSFKDPTMMLVLSLLAGTWGLDRFMLRDIVGGILKLVTLGGFGFWTIIDWFTVSKRTKEKNLTELFKFLSL